MESLGKSVPKPVVSFLERLRAETIFGPPQQQGDVVVVPVAELKARIGYGFGGGTGPNPEANAKGEGAGETQNSGSGAGAGATADLQPRGYIELSPSGARWVPIEDKARLAMASFLMSGWIVFWVAFTIRSVAKIRNSRPG